MYRRKAGRSYLQVRRVMLRKSVSWKPPAYGLCPECEEKLLKELKKEKEKEKILKEKQPKDLREWVEISDRGQKVKKEGESEREKEQPEREKTEKKTEKEETAKKQEKIKTPFGKLTKEDIEKAKQGEEAASEFEKLIKESQYEAESITAAGLAAFSPVTEIASPTAYRDHAFISKLKSRLKDWITGYAEKKGKTGARLKVKEYIRSKGKKPFVTRVIKSVKGKKVLILADFSGSTAPFAHEYKKAIINTAEVLDSLGIKTAVFGFGPYINYSEFFRFKKFEEPKWDERHAAKIAGVNPGGGTPLSGAYMNLEKYVSRHRPHIFITLTDGAPGSITRTQKMIDVLKRKTKMVAFGIGYDRKMADAMKEMLEKLGYNKSFAITTREVHNLPDKIADLLIS